MKRGKKKLKMKRGKKKLRLYLTDSKTISYLLFILIKNNNKRREDLNICYSF